MAGNPLKANRKTGWVIFSLFVWLNLAQGIYPLPSQQVEYIANQASEAVENSGSLVNQGVQMSEEEWIVGLTKSYWFSWIINFIFLLLGLFSSYLLFKNSHAWPILIAILSIIILWVNIPSLFRILVDFESISRFTHFWSKMIRDNGLNSIHTLFIWPLYSIPLLGLSIKEFLNRSSSQINAA